MNLEFPFTYLVTIAAGTYILTPVSIYVPDCSEFIFYLLEILAIKYM